MTQHLLTTRTRWANALLAVGLITGSATAAEVNTSGLSQNGWFSDDTRADGSGSQTAGTNLVSPTLTDAPESGGGDSAHDADILQQILFGLAPGTVPSGTHPFAVNLNIAPGSGSGKAQISHRKDDGTGHADGSIFGPGFAVEYSWMGDGTTSVTASFKIGLKTTEFALANPSSRTGENAWDKLLIYEPGNLNGGISNGVWNTEATTFTSGTWWIVDRIVGGGNTIGAPMTLSAMATSPTAIGGRTVADVWAVINSASSIVTSIQFGIGSGNAGGSVYVNQLETSFYRTGDVTTFGGPEGRLALEADGWQDDANAAAGYQIEVEVWMRDLVQNATGFQAFLSYDTAALDFRADLSSYSALPFTQHFVPMAMSEIVAGTGDLNLDGLAPFGGPGTAADSLLATLVFDVLPAQCLSAAPVWFRDRDFDSELSFEGDPLLTGLDDAPSIALDDTAPVITYCPPDLAVQCIEDADPGLAFGVAVGGVGVYYNDNGGGENPLNQAYLQARFSAANGNGAEFNFDTAPLTGFGPLTWYGLFQAVPNQFGLDLVLPAPTWDTITPIPDLHAYDNGNNSLPGAIDAGSVTWALSGYTGASDGPANPANGIINSLFRSNGIDPGSVTVTRADLSLSGTVYTLDIEGSLVADGITHWYTIGTPDSPMSNFGLNGTLYFSGTLTYDSAGDDGTDLVDFYAGTITVTANFPSSATGIALATDNCTSFPVVTYNDVDNGGSGCNGDPLIITRTWSATDDCANVATCVQVITVEDTTAPTFLFVPDDIKVLADAGGCDAAVTVEPATATDNCVPGPLVVTGVRSDSLPLGDPYPATGFGGPVTITWSADDGCGNIGTAMTLVEVHPYSELTLSVDLLGSLPASRCIALVTDDCANGADVTLGFVDHDANGATPVRATDTVLIDCGNWSSLCLKDEQHTKWASTTLSIVGTGFVADTTVVLRPGDTDNDGDVDINDATLFIARFGLADPAGGCPWNGDRGADFSNNGNTGSEDYTLLSDEWLTMSSCSCLSPSVAAPNWILATSLDPDIAEAADLNRDGIIDADDFALFEVIHSLPDTLSRKLRPDRPSRRSRR